MNRSWKMHYVRKTFTIKIGLRVWENIIFSNVVDHLQGNTRILLFLYLISLLFFLSMQANEDVTQIVEILPSISDKWTWLTRHLVSFTSGNQRKIGKSTLRI